MNWKKNLFHSNSVWIALGLSAILIRLLLSPDFIESYYSRGVYLFIRQVFAVLTGWLPFAFVYILFFVLLFAIIYQLFNLFRSKRSWRQKLTSGFGNLLAISGGIVFFFLLLWGYNYGRVPLEDQLQIVPEPLEMAALEKELMEATEAVLAARKTLPLIADDEVPSGLTPPDLESTMRAAVMERLTAFGYPVQGKVRGRLLFPKGLLLRISTAGVYIPFSGEGHIDPGLHHLQLPFVIAHELSHGYGFGDEGTCNFLAYLACTGSDDPYLQYVGHLYYWRYVASDFRAFQPEAYKVYYESLPQGFKNDLIAIRREMDKYPDIFPKFRDAAYNAYLQAQGITEGLKNYDRVIMLVHAWKKKK